MNSEKILEKLDDIFTFVNNIKEKMDSLRDRIFRQEGRLTYMGTKFSEDRRELEKLIYIIKNIGEHLGVEMEMPQEEVDVGIKIIPEETDGDI